MRRPIHALVLCLCALAALTPAASAKELRAVKVCGADRCARSPARTSATGCWRAEM